MIDPDNTTGTDRQPSRPAIALPPGLANVIAVAENASRNMREALERMYGANRDILKLFSRIAEAIKDLPIRLQRSWATAVQNGWYPNAETTAFIQDITDAGSNAIDAFMIDHLRSDWAGVKTAILATHPERAHVLECAFSLHEEERYIASVPLFLAQAEGIIADAYGFSIFMNKEDRKTKVDAIAPDIDDFDSLLIGLLAVNTQLHAGSREASPHKKSKAPNRNGILHGSRKHLDYGSEINSLKAFSLLAFASHVASLSKSDQQP